MSNADVITEKVYCHDTPQNDTACLAAMMNGGMNGQWNNPFIYLVWMMFAQRMWGNDWQKNVNDPTYGYNALSNQIASFQTRMQDNHNTDMIFNQIQGTNGELRSGINKVTDGQAILQQTLCGIKSAISEVGGQIGYSAERVINAANLGDSNIIQALKDCCCENKTNTLKMGYENQLAITNQTNNLQKSMTDMGFAVQNGFDRTMTGLERGFASVAYENQKQACDIINAGSANTQRIIDTMNAHWQADLQQRYNDARLELSQKAQNEYLVAQLKTT